MLYNFAELFPSQGKQFNKLTFTDTNKILNIHNIGLHNITNIKIVKELRLHSHSFSEIHFSLNGYAVYQFPDGSIIKLTSGNWLLIPAKYPHKIIEYSEQYVKSSCAFTLLDLLNESSSDISLYAYEFMNEILKKGEHQCGKISELSEMSIRQIFSLLFNNHPLKLNIIEALTTSIILDTLSVLIPKAKKTPPSAQNNDHRFKIAIQFINDNINRKISAQDVAKKVYISPRHLDRIFMENMAVSATEFIFEQKCENAKEMLRSTTLSILEISEQLGFSDCAYFSRFFKKRTGITPSKFRKSSQKGE